MMILRKVTSIVIVVVVVVAGQVGQNVPLASDSMDVVIGTLLLCSVPDVAAVLKGECNNWRRIKRVVERKSAPVADWAKDNSVILLDGC